MADPLLTSLCGICHMREPKYKCPRCFANTCSLPCVKKHKKWSSCNGERDPTVYMPPSQLRTDAGIDHDYNFLTKIERSLEQTEKLLVNERGILPDISQQQNDRSHGPPHKRARLSKGQSRGRTTLDGGSRSWARAAIGRLRALDITVKHQPYGMTRPKNNTTSFNKRTQTLNWQVEWCFLGSAASTSTENSPLQPGKLLNKTLDSVPIYLGYADCRESHRRSQMSKKEKEQEKKQKQSDDAAEMEEDDTVDSNAVFGGQDWESSTWAAASVPVQDKSGLWHTSTVPGDPRKPSDRQRRAETTKDEFQFYYHVPGTPSREDQKLIPVNPDETLASVLSGLEVLEFPSIYVTPAGMRLPQGYRRANRPTTNSSTSSRGGARLPQKRKGEVLVEYGSGEEEGEVADKNDTEELGSDAGLDPEDDTTSSSGSDSDGEME